MSHLRTKLTALALTGLTAVGIATAPSAAAKSNTMNLRNSPSIYATVGGTVRADCWIINGPNASHRSVYNATGRWYYVKASAPQNHNNVGGWVLKNNTWC